MNRQFSIPVHSHLEAPKRPNTWSSQRESLLAYSGWIEFDIKNDKYNSFVKENVLNGKSKSEIFESLNEFLFTEKIVPPTSKNELERSLRTSIESTSDELEAVAYSKLPKNSVNLLNNILFKNNVDSEYGELFEELSKTPPSPGANKFKELVQLEMKVRSIATELLVLQDVFSEKMIKEYSESAEKWSKWELKRFSEEKRSIILSCFIIYSYACLLDNLVQMFDRLVSKMKNKMNKAWNEFVLEKNRANLENRKLILLAAEIFSKSNESELLKAHKTFDHAALKEALKDKSSRGDSDEEDKAEIMAKKEHNFRPILQNFLKLDFKIATGLNDLHSAVECARKLNSSMVAKEEVHYIEKKYHNCAEADEKNWKRELWSWFFILEIRKRLRAQDIYFPLANKNNGIWSNLIDTKIPISIENTKDISAIDDLLTDFKDEFEQFKNSLPKNSYVKITNGSINLSKDPPIPNTIPGSFKSSIMSAIGRIRIEDLFQEIEARTNFSSAFRHHSTNEPISKSRNHILHATLIAQATNLGLTGLASASEGITAEMLEDINKCFISQENIKEAIRRVVDFQASLEVGNMWGQGNISSSDGQLFTVRGKSLAVEYHPRRFGWMKRGINVYTHTSDRYSVFSSTVLSCSTREWVAVLDGLLDNDTVLNPKIHTTDTHGYTDHMFALSWLLGFTFAPRIKDAGGSALWVPDNVDVGDLSSIFKNEKISLDNLKNNWELAQRVTAALKQKLVDGRTICMRLANSPTDPLAKSLLEVGRIIKSTYLLRWMRDSQFRRNINLQLNKGESRHELARNINFASGAGLRGADPRELMNRTSILALACNIVVAWNTLQIENVLSAMKADMSLPENFNGASVSPLNTEGIIRTGTYNFRAVETLDVH